MIKRCSGCGEWLPPSASACLGCDDDPSWRWATRGHRGAGKLVSWSVVHARLGGPVAIPAQVKLDEGPWLSTTLHLPEPAAAATGRAGPGRAWGRTRPARPA